jgi:hypothetical protein
MSEKMPHMYDNPEKMMHDLAYAAGYTGIEQGDMQRHPEERDVFSASEAPVVASELLGYLPYHLQSQESPAVDYQVIDGGSGVRFHEWTQQYGELTESVNEQGPIVEVGGPTAASGNVLAQTLRPDFVSNLKQQPVGLEASMLDFVADGRALPLADESVGGIAVHSMNGLQRLPIAIDGMPPEETANLRNRVISEAIRVTKPDGYIVWGDGTVADFADFMEQGINPVFVEGQAIMSERSDGSFIQPTLTINAVFQKSPSSPVN